MSYLLNSLRAHPELAIFLTLAVGFVIGRIKIGSFKFGNVLGTLIAGVIIGQLDIKVDATVKSVFFSLFLFATGYKVGPQFFAAEEERDGPGRAHGGPLRDQPGDDAGGGKAAELRHRDRGRPDGRRVHRIDRDRHRQRHDRPARAPRRGEDETEEQHPRRLCGELPRGHRIRRLVSLGRGTTPAARRHEGREQETGGSNVRGRRWLGPEVRLAYKEWSIRAYRLADTAGGKTVGDSNTPRNPSASSWNASVEAPSCSMPRRGDVASGRCAGHRCAAQSAAQRKAADSRRNSRTPRCSTSPWRSSTSW